MRFNAECTLVELTQTQDQEGNAAYERVETEAFCNEYSVSATSYMAAKTAGLHADAEIELRSIDYSGQQIVVVDEIEYNIERVENTGDFTRLVLARRATNE